MKPHLIAQLINELEDIAVKYHDHGCLRELIIKKVLPAIKEQDRDTRHACANDVLDEVFSLSDQSRETWPKGIITKIDAVILNCKGGL